MQQNEFEQLVKALCQQENLPKALELLKASDDEEISQAAQSLTGQFVLAEVDGERRVYHVSYQENDAGEETEYLEHIMNEGEHLVKFAAWFFDSMFEVKAKETYQAAGKTYQQPKRS
ncbi:hypothetical protein WMQ48_06105 [Vibrio cidicii]|uniref:hypothetical protein n=1 Tax=Vibrio cidicii TaxID=1763883 RepID=UPI00375367DC